jgi:SSS family solute:Na+ symporter
MDGAFHSTGRIAVNTKLLIILLYLIIALGIGTLFRKKAQESKVEFFLAGRNLSRLLLFFTMTATNFSAFTIFGFSGAGYRMGYSFYPVMGFGTGFMALSFIIIGRKILLLSRERGYMVPSDYIYDRYGSLFLKKLFSSIMIVFTLPYIALQAIASGRSLQSLVGLPYFTGALLVTSFVVAYVILGGMRSIAWTDLFQGVIMLAFTLAALFLIAGRSGGFVRTHDAIRESFPEMFARPGLGNAMTPGIWIGYMVLWFAADPMFPQLFQRFMAAKNDESLGTTIVLYPLVTTALFFFTVSIGVLGRGTFPHLEAGASDTIFPLLLGRYTGVFTSTLLLTGSLAALMSTMDSQLLTLTAMISVDFLPVRKREVLRDRVIVLLLGAAGLLIALRPPHTILDFISRTTFNGLAVLAPAVIGGLYWRRANRYGAAASMILGEGMVVLYYAGVIHTPTLHPILPILSVSTVGLIVGSLLAPSPDENRDIVFTPSPGSLLWSLPFALIFLLGNDFWNWARRPVILLGLPLWVLYFMGLGILLSLTYALYLRKHPA